MCKIPPFRHRGNRAQDYYETTDKVVRHGCKYLLQLTTMERSPYGNRIQDVVTSRQITKAGKVIGIESLRETCN